MEFIIFLKVCFNVFFDSVLKKKCEFIPHEAKKANIYLCGPTVYDDAHLGHARSSVCFDFLRRVLLASDYEVVFARNYTDIDDKILKKMQESGKSLEEITNFYIKRYEEDMQALNILEPNFKPKATAYIEQMIIYIEKLLELNLAYKLEDGIYFDTSKDDKYFYISKRNLEDNQSRLEESVAKKMIVILFYGNLMKNFILQVLAKEDQVGTQNAL